MTENEAIERLKCMRLFMQINDKSSESKFLEEDYIANEMAIKAIKEIQQYRAIGTVEECREARERQRAKRVYSKDGKLNHCEANRALSCPVCKAQLNYCEYQDIPFCYNCGQKLDWSDAP